MSGGSGGAADKRGTSTGDLGVLEPRAPGRQDAGVASFHMTVSVGAAELSIVDHCVEEVLLVTVLGFRLEHAARIGAAADFSRLSLNIQQLQVDDMMFGTRCAPRSLQGPLWCGAGTA